LAKDLIPMRRQLSRINSSTSDCSDDSPEFSQ
jgi:hypothetical protein